MSRAHRLVVAAGIVAGVLYGIASLANPYQDSASRLLIHLLIEVPVGWSFLFIGVVAVVRRPGNRAGFLISMVGLLWFSAGISWINTPVTIAIGRAAQPIYLVVLAQLYVGFPHGRPTGSLEKGTIAAAYIWFALTTVATQLTYQPLAEGCLRCPSNPFYVGGSNLHHLIGYVSVTGTLLLACVVLGILAWHWQAATPPARRVLAPAVWAALPLFSVVVVQQLANLNVLPPWLAVGVGPVEAVVFTALPLGLLAGILRTRLGRGAVSDLVVELGRTPPTGGLRDALARVLGDPSLQLALALPGGGYVDSEGRPVALPEPSQGRAVSMIFASGLPVAALIHDPAVEEEDPGLVAAAGSAAQFAIENERLQGEVRARLEEVRASRERILGAADAERRRLERDIHDGAQQRLVALSLDLRRSRYQAALLGAPTLAAGLDEAADQLKQALAELRRLAQGIHPAVLTRAGIGPALRSLAELSPVPVELVEVPQRRYPEAVEAAVYFCASEALANVAKHSGAGRASVSVQERESRLRLVVADDGSGGANSGTGSGLVGMADRVAVLGGSLDVRGPPGGGTELVVEIPCG